MSQLTAFLFLALSATLDGQATAGATPPFEGFQRAKTRVSLSIEEVIRWAAQKNLAVVIEAVNREIAAKEIVAARATFDPYFNLSAAYLKNRDPSANVLNFSVNSPVVGVQVNPTDTTQFKAGFRGLSPIGTTYQISLVETRTDSPRAGIFSLNPRYSTEAEVLLTQPLLKDAWLPFNMAVVRTAQNNLQLSREQLELTVITAVYEVELAYWDLVFALKNFESKQRALSVSREQLRIEQKKVEVGTKARIDITTAESQVARRETEYDQSQALLEDARDALLDRMNYIGTEESLKRRGEQRNSGSPFEKYGDLAVFPTTEPTIGKIEVDRSKAVAAAFEQRIEYHQIDLQIKNQEIAVQSARNQLLPALGLNAGWTQLGLDQTLTDSTGRTFDGDFYDWSVGLVFEVPLSMRGPRAKYQNARSLLQTFRIQKQNLENVIVLEVDKAIRDLDFALRAVENYARQVTYQEELLRAERVKLEVGKSIAYTVAEIENDLIAVQALSLRARRDYEAAKAAYHRAVGDLLKKRGIDFGR